MSAQLLFLITSNEYVVCVTKQQCTAQLRRQPFLSPMDLTSVDEDLFGKAEETTK